MLHTTPTANTIPYNHHSQNKGYLPHQDRAYIQVHSDLQDNRPLIFQYRKTYADLARLSDSSTILLNDLHSRQLTNDTRN